MSLARTRRLELINNELTKEDFHDIDAVSDIELEGYALSSIVIERLWPFQKMFLQRYELPLIPKDEQFWVNLHQAFLGASQAFAKERLLWLEAVIYGRGDESPEHRAVIRYLMIRKQMDSLGLPVIDDAYYFCIQLMRVAVALDPEQAFNTSIQKPMAYIMAQSRPFSRWITRSISLDPRGAENDLSNPFLPSAFCIKQGALEFDAETKAQIENMEPAFAKWYEQTYGKPLRALQCPVLYAKPRIFTDIIDWIVVEIKQQYHQSPLN